MTRHLLFLALLPLCLFLQGNIPTTMRPAYDRAEWRHWVDTDKDCQNTRMELLILHSRVPVTFATEKNCRVIAGEWRDAYSGDIITAADQLHIDHLVSLRDAHYAGGWKWTREQKEQYANDLHTPGLLVITHTQLNTRKGAAGPHHWQPPNSQTNLEYVAARLLVKLRYGLRFEAMEIVALSHMLLEALVEAHDTK